MSSSFNKYYLQVVLTGSVQNASFPGTDIWNVGAIDKVFSA